MDNQTFLTQLERTRTHYNKDINRDAIKKHLEGLLKEQQAQDPAIKTILETLITMNDSYGIILKKKGTA